MGRALIKTVGNLAPHSSKAKTKERRMLGMTVSTLFPQGFGHMKQEYPTYLKTIGKSKALATTLSDTEPEDDSDNKDDGILNAFTATVNPIEGIVEDVDEEEELVESKFEKMDEQDDILCKVIEGLR